MYTRRGSAPCSLGGRMLEKTQVGPHLGFYDDQRMALGLSMRIHLSVLSRAQAKRKRGPRNVHFDVHAAWIRTLLTWWQDVGKHRWPQLCFYEDQRRGSSAFGFRHSRTGIVVLSGKREVPIRCRVSVGSILLQQSRVYSRLPQMRGSPLATN